MQGLRGNTVYLEPLKEGHRESLRQLARDERLWEFTKTLLINETYDDQFDKYFAEALGIGTEGGQTFVIRSVKDDAIIGMTRIMHVEPKDKRAEIGHTWYTPSVWGKRHNKECKLLLLEYIFETAKYCRVEFRVAHQNIRSQTAVEKIGGFREGVLRKFTYRNDGSVRHTVVFSIIDEEWPEKKENLRQLVTATPED
ncbi:MAG TPA: GNAT family protein [Puia sp.]|nr:GNAT family protein [Puia sp.]